MRNALTIDVEEYFQVHAFEEIVPRSDWESYPSRVVASTRRVLRLLGEHDVHATFFILGWVADRHPRLVQEIAEAGHEIAAHGYAHELIYRQTRADFAADLDRTIDAITRPLNGIEPVGYRAPSFSITRQSLWALDVLREKGMAYDSSIFPLVAHDRYGINTAQRFANQVADGLWEFPVSTVRFGRKNWPVAGGGYFRVLPLWITRWAIRRINAEGEPAVLYLHPWEFDPDQPRMRDAPLLSRLRHYTNIGKTEARLRALLSEFSFGPMKEVFADHLRAD